MNSAYGLDPEQFATRIVIPSLRTCPHWSAKAGAMVLGTGMTETELRFVRQIGGGPALSLYQMEPATFHDLRSTFIRGDLKNAIGRLRAFLPVATGVNDAEEMEGNLYFATAMCRAKYLQAEEPIPELNEPEQMARYWKRFYNTPKGKGTVERAIPHFQLACQIFSNLVSLGVIR